MKLTNNDILVLADNCDHLKKELSKWQELAGRMAQNGQAFIIGVESIHKVPYEDWADELKAFKKDIADYSKLKGG